MDWSRRNFKGTNVMAFRDLHGKRVAIELSIGNSTAGNARKIVQGIATYVDSKQSATLKIALQGAGSPVIHIAEDEWRGTTESGAQFGCDFLLVPAEPDNVLESVQTDSTMKSSISTETPWFR